MPKLRQQTLVPCLLSVLTLLLSGPVALAQASPYFTAGNLVVSVEGNGVVDSAGTYGDNQAAPLTLFQFAPDPANPTGSAATYVDALVFPQAASGANLPVSGEYGSSSEGTLQLSGTSQYLTIAGYGVNAAAFNANSNAYSAAPNAALAQSGSLTGQGYTPVPRVIALVDPYGNVNSSTVLYNIFNGNNPRSVYTADGFNFYVSGQGTSPDNTGGVFYTTLGLTNYAPVSITGNDEGNNPPQSQDTRTVQIYNSRLYVSIDSKEGSTNRDFIATLGTGVPTTTTSGPVALSGYGNSGGTGKVTITAATANGINSNGSLINLSPQNYFFASPSVLYVADSGSPKNSSNANSAGVDLGDGGLQKWVNSASNGSGTWSLKYTLAKGLNLVPNATAGGTVGATGLIGLTGKVVGGNVQLFATNYNIGDLDPTYLYGIADPLSATANPGTSFTQLAAAPANSNFKGVSFAPSLSTGSATITSSPSGLAFTTSGAGCAPGTYTTPVTLTWTPGSACALSLATTQTAAGVDYTFTSWQDGTTATTDNVTAQSSPTVYNANFSTAYLLTTSATTGGTVSAGGYFPAGSTATVTATPASGYYFVNFTGAVTSTSNPLSLPMTGPQSITANFAPQTAPTVNWPAAGAITYGQALSASVLSGGSASVAGTFAFSNPGVIPVAGTSAQSVTFTPNSSQYTAVTSTVYVTVNPATLTASVNGASFVYGGALPLLTGTVSGLVNGDSLGAALSVSFASTVAVTANAGVYPGAITATLSGPAAGNYTLSVNPGTLTIVAAPLSVAVNPASFVYGGSLPAFTGTVTGLVNGDQSNVVAHSRAALKARDVGTDVIVAYSTAVPATSSVGDYSGAITATVSGTGAANYTVTVTPADLTITPAPLSVAVNPASFVYGGSLPAFTGTVTGLVNGDQSNVVAHSRAALKPRDVGTDVIVAYSTAVQATSSVGDYSGAITATVSGTGAANYTVTVTPADLTITPAPLSVAVNPASFVYGGSLPAFTGTVTGLVNGDQSNVVAHSRAALKPRDVGTDVIVAYSTAVQATSSVGDYSGAITATVSGTGAANYTVTVTPADLTITPAPLSVAVNPASYTYGGPFPRFSGVITGLQNGDTLVPYYSVSIKQSSKVGIYPGVIKVSLGGAALGNYSLTVSPGTLTVTPARLTIVPVSKTKVYGATLPGYGYNVTGLVNGDTAASAFSGTPLLSGTATVSAPVGAYPITADVSGLTSQNYIVGTVAGTLTVTPAGLRIVASAASAVYGAALPNFTYSVAGLVNGDTAATALSGTPAFSSASPGSPAGTYAIVPSAGSLRAANYNLIFEDGTLTIKKATLVITASPASAVYYGALPSLAYTVSGLVNGDTAATALRGSPVETTTAAVGSPAGAYTIAITAGTLTVANGNYTFSLAGGKLTITKAALLVTAAPATRVYGKANPAFAYTFSGFLGTDTASAVKGKPAFTSGATAASPAGVYNLAVAQGSLTAANYTFNFAGSTLTVTPATLTVAAQNATAVYNQPLPVLTDRITGYVNGDTAATAFTGAPSLSTTAALGSPIGSYPITASAGTLESANYTFAFTNATLKIVK